MPDSASNSSIASTFWDRILGFPVTKIVLAMFATIAPVALILVGAHTILEKSIRFAWPQLLAACACIAGYRLYTRWIEHRPASEVGGPGAGRELGAGVLLGTALLLATLGFVAVAGSYRITGINSARVLISPLTEMALVATFEEIVFRGILFRIAAQSVGSWIALLLSAALFAAAHLPNAEISVLAILFTFAAGVVLAAAYMVTGRLWLPIGIHFAWNFLSDAVFSLPTSGHPAAGLIQGRLEGSEWLTGGSYGVEGSAESLGLFVAAAVMLLIAAGKRQRISTLSWNRAGR